MPSPALANAQTEEPLSSEEILDLVKTILDDDKAEDIVVIDLAGKTSIADYMVIATGNSSRMVSAMADRITSYNVCYTKLLR